MARIPSGMGKQFRERSERACGALECTSNTMRRVKENGSNAWSNGVGRINGTSSRIVSDPYEISTSLVTATIAVG